MEDAYNIRELLRSWNDKHTRRRVDSNEETMMDRKEVLRRRRNKLRSEEGTLIATYRQTTTRNSTALAATDLP